MLLHWGFLGLALPAAVYATEVSTRQLNNDLYQFTVCPAVRVVIAVLQESAAATSRCEAALAPRVTSTVTSTETHSSCAYTYAATQTQKIWPQPTAACASSPQHNVILGFPEWEFFYVCSCLDISASNLATRTETQTVTSTTTLCPVPTTCNNEGLQWAYYRPNDIPFAKGCPVPFVYDPAEIKDMNDEYNSTTTYVGLTGDGVNDISIYSAPREFNGQYFVLNHRGYIYAEVSGNYTFSSPEADDLALFWAGPDAYSGWAVSNANATVHCSRVTVTMPLLSGQYYPIRLIYVNAETHITEDISITAPDGTAILNSTTTGSPYIVQYSCDGTSAPPYPSFGYET